ncbi:hypothetical protein PsYK624_059950 [Phanerochaete sordida]|uniref:Uncharacterized protein n=1 Tax=Phanerochaete sordida TaxID=48140 RepID=A0A9P3G608_9APHY|nr:hypothetical protein PsYK624_059950 [Phanerochaete sordida]
MHLLTKAPSDHGAEERTNKLDFDLISCPFASNRSYIESSADAATRSGVTLLEVRIILQTEVCDGGGRLRESSDME